MNGGVTVEIRNYGRIKAMRMGRENEKNEHTKPEYRMRRISAFFSPA
jgi:hypothetical protein